MSNLLEKLISRLKNDSSYRIQSAYSKRELGHILFYRGLQILRGIRMRWKFRSVKGLLFAGRRVVVEHGYMIQAGSGLILEDGVRINALSEKGIVVGDNVSIGSGTVIICTGVVSKKGIGIVIGNNVGINSQCFIAGQGGIVIGDDVDIGPQVKIFSENHNFADKSVPIRTQGVKRIGVQIGKDCWIGSGVTILDGVELGQGSVVAAGSVVTASVPMNCVVAGIPAKVIKTR